MEIKAKVKTVFPPETKGNYTFRNLWVAYDYEGQYPQTLELQTSKPDILNNLKEGDVITAHINLRGREWTKDGKTSVFNSIQVWKIEKGAAQEVAQPANGGSEPDSLPF